MIYSNDRNELNNILLNTKEEEILLFADKLLELVPELIICSKCEHENRAHKYNVYIHILHVVAGVENDLTLKLAALFHDIGKPYVKKKVNEKTSYIDHQEVSSTISKLVLNRLGYEEGIIKDACTLIRIHDDKIGANVEAIKLAIDIIGKVNFERLLKLQTSDISAHADGYAEIIMPKLENIKELYSQIRLCFK